MSKIFRYNTGPLFDGGSPRDYALQPFELGVYNLDTVQRFMVGTRYMTWDGRVFRYGKSGDTLSTAHGCWTGDYMALAQWAEFDISHPLGSNPITCTTDATYCGLAFNGVFAEDDLAGGFITMWPTGVEALNYGIIGNDALAAAGTLVIYLDHPLRYPITKTEGSCEAIYSPYRHLHWTGAGLPASSSRHPVLGVPMSNAVSGDFFWMQTWGPIHCSTSDASVGNDNDNAELVWQHDGSIEDRSSAALGMKQHAGFTLAQDYNSGTPQQGSPFFMLQISP